MHVRFGPKISELNLFERTHQLIEGMTKSTMAHAGFHRSLWTESMLNAVYVKNRVYNKITQGILYEMMFGVKHNTHHIRKSEALSYAHIPLSQEARKMM